MRRTELNACPLSALFPVQGQSGWYVLAVAGCDSAILFSVGVTLCGCVGLKRAFVPLIYCGLCVHPREIIVPLSWQCISFPSAESLSAKLFQFIVLIVTYHSPVSNKSGGLYMYIHIDIWTRCVLEIHFLCSVLNLTHVVLTVTAFDGKWNFEGCSSTVTAQLRSSVLYKVTIEHQRTRGRG